MALVCVICTEKLCNNDENDSVNIKTCGHVFHSNCLKKWIEKSSTCPVCRNITIDSPNFIGKLHFQRVSLGSDSSSSTIAQLLDENAEQKRLLQKAQSEIAKKEELLKTKEESWKMKENEYKDKEKTNQIFLKTINDDLKHMEQIREKISGYTRAMITSGPVEMALSKAESSIRRSNEKLFSSSTSTSRNITTRAAASTSSSSRAGTSSSSSTRAGTSSSSSSARVGGISTARFISNITSRSTAASSAAGTSSRVPSTSRSTSAATSSRQALSAQPTARITIRRVVGAGSSSGTSSSSAVPKRNE